jgi:succinate-semialdehyde dehydrogenase/glutarate-semialdehyde dehydrogenase
MLARKIAPALAAGCTIVSKPASETPLTAIALYTLIEAVGFPAGVLNLLPASRQNSVEIGDIICNSPKVRKISFTGSTKVGKLIMKKSAMTLKRLSLELGGNAPFISLEETSNLSIEVTVQRLLIAKLRNSGQTCISPNRIFVHKSNLDYFVECLKKQLEFVKLGPLINAAATLKMTELIQDAKLHGATVIDTNADAKILVGCTSKMRVFNEESFSPIIPIFSYNSLSEAIELSNDTACGLAAYVSGSDLSVALSTSEKIKVGMVAVNTGIISMSQAPFGGVGESGLGREGGVEGLKDYQDLKYTCVSYNE